MLLVRASPHVQPLSKNLNYLWHESDLEVWKPHLMFSHQLPMGPSSHAFTHIVTQRVEVGMILTPLPRGASLICPFSLKKNKTNEQRCSKHREVFWCYHTENRNSMWHKATWEFNSQCVQSLKKNISVSLKWSLKTKNIYSVSRYMAIPESFT